MLRVLLFTRPDFFSICQDHEQNKSAYNNCSLSIHKFFCGSKIPGNRIMEFGIFRQQDEIADPAERQGFNLFFAQ